MMQSKKSLDRYFSIIKKHLNTPHKAGMFVSLLLWSLLIRILLIFPVSKILKYIIPMRTTRGIPLTELQQNVYWLERLKIINQSGDCLARSLLLYRFLALFGEEPYLKIGFRDKAGHAWVELSGNPVSDSLANISKFRPVLILEPENMDFVPAMRSDNE